MSSLGGCHGGVLFMIHCDTWQEFWEQTQDCDCKQFSRVLFSMMRLSPKVIGVKSVYHKWIFILTTYNFSNIHLTTYCDILRWNQCSVCKTVRQNANKLRLQRDLFIYAHKPMCPKLKNVKIQLMSNNSNNCNAAKNPINLRIWCVTQNCL